MKKNKIILIGFMGTGKSSVARALSLKLKVKSLDLDREIVKKEKMPISRIFEKKGEPYFRKVERLMLKKGVKSSARVLSTGGGILLNPLNVRDLKKTGTLIHLTANLNEIWRRTKKNKTRPLLNTKNSFQTIQKLLKSRRPLYQKVADFTVSTSGKTALQSANAIIKKLGSIQ